MKWINLPGIIEERAIGEEFTIQAFCDGEHIAPIQPLKPSSRI